MGKNNYRCLFVTLLMVMLMSSSSWGASISGNVSYSGSKTGRIYLSVQDQGGWNTGIGVSIPAAGNFTIDGVQPGNYIIKAFMDTQGTNVQHANDPSGGLDPWTQAVTVSTSNVFGVNFALNDHSVGALAPQLAVYRGTGANGVMWDGPRTNDDLVIADKYTVEWSTNGSTVAGSKDVPAGFNDFFIHSTPAYSYYRVTAVNGTSSSASAWTPVPAAAGTGSVTGKVYFSGGTPAGTLYVFLMDDSVSPPKFKFTAVASPVSGGSYTISTVPAGTYFVLAFVDMNGNGTYDLGDVGWLDNDDFFPKVTVSTTQVTAADTTINNINSSISLGTNHAKNQNAEWYNIDVTVQSMKKRVANVEIVSGPQFSSAVDVALEDWQEFNTWVWVPARPTVGDTYQIKVTYADATTETVSRSVTAVLDGLPTPVAPVGNIPYSATPPTFSWTAPSPAPAGEYVYSLWMNQDNGGWMWDSWSIPSSTTSLAYGSMGDVSDTPLSNNTTYNWSIEAKDRNSNKSSTQVSFTYSTAPYITSFTPAGGLAGTVVTISGTNFSTTPSANTVLFNGVPATVNAATATTLTVTVPGGATSGTIQVTTSQGTAQSSKFFYVVAPVTIQGYVKTSGDAAAIAGARVESVNDPSLYTTTAADGSFTLNWFQGQNVPLKITKSGYVPTYTDDFWLDGNLDLRPYPSHLYTQAELTYWGITAGKGVIVGRVMNNGTTPYTPVGGAVVTAQGSIFYPVTYYSGTAFGGSTTYSNGIYFVKNVDPNPFISMNASKSSWWFNPSSFSVYANSVTEAGVFGATSPPAINSFSPTTGKAGTSVTISGIYFSDVPTENIVKFNGVAATVTAATTTSLTVTVPATATTGQISVTTYGGSNTHWQTFTMVNTLTAAVTGSIGGTVTSAPSGITCTNANSATAGCTADFDQGTLIDLTATVSAGYKFKNWSGDCTGTTNTCSLTLTANKSVTATFEKLLYIKNGTNYYSTLQEAFDAAATGTKIQAQAQTFTDTDLVFNRPSVQVYFEGGYDSTFSTNNGYTTLDGKLSIRGGTLRVERLKVK